MTHPRWRSLHAWAHAATLTSAALHAHAQQDWAEPETFEAVLPEVRVKAAAKSETATSQTPGYVARRSATATKTDTPLSEVPQSISVITADQVRDQGSQNMQDVLRYTAGVRSEMYGLDNRGDWFTLRGGSEGSVLLDGLRLPLTGGYGLVRNEPYAFERVEVLRGPASVIAGQNGPGGVVNLVSKRPLAEAQREVQLQAGNHNHKQAAADFTGPLNDDSTLLYRVIALAKHSDTQVDHAYDRRRFFAPSLTWQPSAVTSITAFAEYQNDHSGNTNAFLPIAGTLQPAPNGFVPIDTFIGEPDWDRYGGERTRMGYRLEHKLNDRWTLRQSLRYDKVQGGMRTMYANWQEGYRNADGTANPNGRYLNRTWHFSDDKGRVTNADALLEGKLTFGSTRHTLLFGVDGMTSLNSTKSWDGAATPLDVYAPVYGSFPMPMVADVPATVTRVRNWGVLAQDQIKFNDHWVLVAGLRHDRATTRVDSTPDAKDSATSKNLGLVHLFDNGLSPYASYSESFEPVGSTDAAGETFKPKRGKQLEAGMKWAPAHRRVSMAAAIYRLKELNRLTSDPDNVDSSVQRGTVTIDGLELEAAAQLRDWDLLASYTHMDARQTGVSSADTIYLNKQLSGIPHHSASLWAVRKFGDLGLPGLKTGLGMRYTGATTDGIDVITTPSSTLLDLLLSYEKGPWTTSLNVGNLTNKTYIATCLDRGDCWFGTKRRAVLSVAYRW